MPRIYCHICKEYYIVPPKNQELDFKMEVISKPGAAILVKQGKIPPYYQAQISHNIQCSRNKYKQRSWWTRIKEFLHVS